MEVSFLIDCFIILIILIFYMIFQNTIEEFISFPKYANELAQKYKNAILVENIKESYKDLDDVLELLKEHIQQNIIKVLEYLNNLFLNLLDYLYN
jgi:predicted PurR-regulated permease PerM